MRLAIANPNPAPETERMEPVELYEEEEQDGVLELPSEPMRINMGPSHPAMHGTIRMVLDLDGETIEKIDVQPGYLHRGFEKSCERGTWAQVFPYTDRLNYVPPMICNVGFAMTVEQVWSYGMEREPRNRPVQRAQEGIGDEGIGHAVGVDHAPPPGRKQLDDWERIGLH